MKIHISINSKSIDAIQSLDLVVSRSQTVASVKETVSSAQHIPFPQQELCFEGVALADESRLAASGISDNSTLQLKVKATETTLCQQLRELLASKDLSIEELGLLYCYTYGASIEWALRLLGHGDTFADYVAKQKLLWIKDGAIGVVRPTQESAQEASDASEAEKFVELHSTIYSKSFNTEATNRVNELVSILSGIEVLNSSCIAVGGSVAKGTMISSHADAEVVVFSREVDAAFPGTSMQSLLSATAGVLAASRDSLCLDDVEQLDHSLLVHMKCSGGLTVRVYMAPVFENHAEALQVVGDEVVFGENGADARKLYSPSFVRERTQFVARQPSSVKMTIRLIKWWRDQQTWHGDLARPCDEILELATIYSAATKKPKDQADAIEHVLELFSKFKKVKVIWSNHYSKDDVWGPLLRQKPLLMDPANPYVNVADPSTFDPRELIELARSAQRF